jgi:hypothetical protein
MGNVLQFANAIPSTGVASSLLLPAGPLPLDVPCDANE